MEGPVPITIEVKDVNDNRPTFLQSKYEGSVRQNSRPGNRQGPEIFMERWKGVRWKGQTCVANGCSCHSISTILPTFHTDLGVV